MTSKDKEGTIGSANLLLVQGSKANKQTRNMQYAK